MEKVKIGDYEFSKKCLYCPYVRLAVDRVLAEMALFGPSLGPRNFEDFRSKLVEEIESEFDGTNASLMDGCLSETCDGASSTFFEESGYEKAGNSNQFCNRKIVPFEHLGAGDDREEISS